ncbi:MAG: ATP-dependent helicase, partial [Desulfovibrio sp.]|nr:ATP-dependent helicase [Desulfovibrio sp.]
MIDYEADLNPAQYAAATAGDGPVLVIAGAGSGKTRTIVYRLAWLAEQGVAPTSMLLLTFTRKAAQEMLHRAARLLRGADSVQGNVLGVQGGTFHGFAYGALRHYRPEWLEGRPFSVMDAADITAAIAHCKDARKLGKGDRSFPRTQAIASLFSKARNKEQSLRDILQREAFHLLPHAEALEELLAAYAAYRREQGLLDYDDLLFELEALLQANGPAAQALRSRYAYTMVDEYQDTNLVQARLVRLLTARDIGGSGNVMAVGDDAQSIYAFRGADVRNIRDFPELFPDTRVIKLEENYRSTQPVLDVANSLLAHAANSFHKHLFTSTEGGAPVRLVRTFTDRSQAAVVARRVRELLHDLLPHEIAVLFRAGFHSYQLELLLRQEGIAFRKYGGLKLTDAAHVKDVTSYARLCLNPLDMPAFLRLAALHKGIGPKTAQRLYQAVARGAGAAVREPQADAALAKAFAKYP